MHMLRAGFAAVPGVFADKHLVLGVAPGRVLVLGYLRQRADKPPRGVIAVRAVRVYDEVRVSAYRIAPGVVAARAVLMQLKAALEHGRLAFKRDARQYEGREKHQRRERGDGQHGHPPRPPAVAGPEHIHNGCLPSNLLMRAVIPPLLSSRAARA